MITIIPFNVVALLALFAFLYFTIGLGGTLLVAGFLFLLQLGGR